MCILYRVYNSAAQGTCTCLVYGMHLQFGNDTTQIAIWLNLTSLIVFTSE